MARGIRLGFENVDDSVDNEDDVSTVAERPEESVESQLIETKDVEAEDAVAEADGDQLVEDLRAVVEQAEVVIESLEEGGMTETAARATEIATESIAKRWNLKRQKLGTENYRGSNRVNATRLGLEGILETASGIGRRIMEWIIKRLNDMRAIWDKYVNLGKSSKKRIETLRNKVRDLRGSVDDGDTLPTGMGWQFGPIVEAKAAKKGAKATEEVIRTAKQMQAKIESADKYCGLFMNAAGDLVTMEAGKGKNAAPKVTPSDIELVTGGNSEVKLKKLFPANAAADSRRILPSVGGAILNYKDGDGNDCWKWADVTASYYHDVEMKPLTVPQMNAMLDEAFNTASDLNQFFQKRRKSLTSMEKLKSDISKAKDKYNKAFDKKDASSESVGEKRKEVDKAKVMFDNAVQFDIIFRKVASCFIQVAITLVQASMKKYKAED